MCAIRIDPTTIIRLPWSFVLGPKSTALRAVTAGDTLSDLLPPGTSRIDEVVAVQSRRPSDADKRSRVREHFLKIVERLSGPRSARDAAGLLADPKTFLVITGQQAGLLGGPLYTILKAACAISTARSINKEKGIQAVPCFWVASEDVDFEEVHSFNLLDAHNHPVCFSHQEGPPAGTPISGIPLAPDLWKRVEEFLKENLRETEFRPGILDGLKKTFESSKTWSDWTAKILWDLFPDGGLLISLPEDGFYQEECVDIFEREINAPEATARDLEAAGKKLVEMGLHPQIHKREDVCSFFLIRDCLRKRVEYKGGVYRTDGETFSREDLLGMLRADPAVFGASAALRPVCQDAALPVIASVLGPGEIGYYAQIENIYKRHGVPRPAFLPRLSATFFPKRFLGWLDEAGLDVSDPGSPVTELLKRAAAKSAVPNVENAIAALRNEIRDSFALLNEEATILDPTISPALEKSKKRIDAIVDGVEDLFVRRKAALDHTLRNRLETVKSWFFPAEKPQERILNGFFLLNLYGPDLFRELVALGLDAGSGHYLVPL